MLCMLKDIWMAKCTDVNVSGRDGWTEVFVIQPRIGYTSDQMVQNVDTSGASTVLTEDQTVYHEDRSHYTYTFLTSSAHSG